MALMLYNSLGRELMPFVPIKEGEAGIYACGPTVYNYAHIGNLRMYVSEDLLRRSLAYLGYKINHVMNVTDVGHLTDDAASGEDKMLKSSRDKGKTVWEIAEDYSNAFFRDAERLNVIKPNVISKATDHIDIMINLIKRLEAKGFTYLAGGNVYFDISKFPAYGNLALLDRQSLKAGARIEVDENKKNPYDFVLWFTKSKFENQAMLWDSPWGIGYPGWHIECSAMSMKYLGEQIDIHCGGVDHIPIHHTNEIAQSEAATGKKWVNFWIHGEFLLLDKGKMAKSSGTFLTLQSLIDQGYNPLDYRYFCLGGHYRSQLQYSEESLSSAKAGRENLLQRLRDLWEAAGADRENLPEPKNPKTLKYLASFTDNLEQDINIPKALSDLWGLVKDGDIPPGERIAAALRMDKVFGLDLADAARPVSSDELDPECSLLIKEREKARKDKNFKRADEIRDILVTKGINIKDTPDGTKWVRTL